MAISVLSTLTALVATAWLSACAATKDGGDADASDGLTSEALTPDTALAGDTPEAGELSTPGLDPGCLACEGIEGMAFRFTSLLVTEPDDPDSTTDGAIRDYLNEMWRRDIANEIFNVFMRITAYDPASGRMNVTVGSAMRFPDGLFHFICGTTGDYELQASPGSCDYANVAGDQTLRFHTGPVDAPVYCAPELTPQNAVPIRGLATQLTLDTDCQAGTASVSAGFLAGWVPEIDADRICFCSRYDASRGVYDCEDAPQPGHAQYCFANCGAGYGLFGSILKIVAKVTPTPDPFDGTPSFRIAGYYDAESLSDFDPRCCSSASECQ